jgi:putative flippase GtrA
MNLPEQRRPLPLLRFTVVRFGIVGLLGELLYLLLYAIFISLTNHTASTLALAGGICILVNSYSHSRITFRVKFGWKLMLGYLQIQLLGFGLAFISGLALEKFGASKWLIALLTYTLWTMTSYFLTSTLYRKQVGRQHHSNSMAWRR